MADTGVRTKPKGSVSTRKSKTSGIETAIDIYSKPSGGGASSQVFHLTETNIPNSQPSITNKKLIGSLKNLDSVKNNKLPLLTPSMKNFNTTGQFAKNFIFPNIKKSTSLMNLRAQTSQSKPKKKAIDLQRITSMAAPKQDPKYHLDINKEKGELADEIRHRNNEACKFIRTMYQGQDQTMINEYVASIESLQVVKDKIEQFKKSLQDQIKQHNELSTETKYFLQILEEQNKQLDLLKKNNELDVADSEKLTKLKLQNKDVRNMVDMELLYSEQMNHMIERDKKQIICFKMPIQEKKDDIAKLVNSIKSVHELKAIMLTEISRYENAEKSTNVVQDNKKKIKENLKEMYVQDICQYAIFGEVYRNQMKIIYDKELEIKQKKADELQHKNNLILEKLKEEEKKKSEANEKNQEFEEEFIKLKRQCNVKGISDLMNYHQDLIVHKSELKNIQQMMQSEIEEQQKKLKEKREQLIKLKYLVDENSKSKPAPEEEQNLVKLSKVEIDYNQVDHEKNKEEIMKRKKKAKEVIASAIMSVARIACQLKEESKITPQNVDQKLSVCGLRLEHMVATLYKKKPTFNIESVNTDYSSDLPPFFLGIKYAIYVNPPANEGENENDLERLLQISQAKPDQTPDEENDFVNDQYTKQKRINKALKSSNANDENDKKNQTDKNSKSAQKANIMNMIKQRPETQGSSNGTNTGSTNTGTGNSDGATQGGKLEKDNYDQVFKVLSGGKDRNKNKTPSQQVVILTEKEKEEMKTKEKIQKQLMKIVHKTWYIYDPDKKQKAIANANPFKSKLSPTKKEKDQNIY